MSTDDTEPRQPESADANAATGPGRGPEPEVTDTSGGPTPEDAAAHGPDDEHGDGQGDRHKVPEGPDLSEGDPVAIVINPSKFVDLDQVKRETERAARKHGIGEVRWYDTTVDDPGEGAARQALDDGAKLVCSFGGDGTVRAVASVLAHGDIPMGLLPGGTGNLFARNLDLPVDDFEAAAEAAFTGPQKWVDTALVAFSNHEGDTREERFLVMCGMGLDADTMADVNERLKARIGWVAYVLAGARDLVRAGFRACVDSPRELSIIQHARTVLIGNCGALQAGLKLMPDALVDDGLLDVAVVAPPGVVGWAAMVGDIVTRSRHGHRLIARRQAAEFTVRLSDLQRAEIDGDYIGDFERMQAHCDPRSLLVRTASPKDRDNV